MAARRPKARPPDWRAKKIIEWGRKNQHRILAKPLEAQVGELAETQRQIEEIVKFIGGKTGRKRKLYSDRLRVLKAKRTFLIHEIELGKKALKVLESEGLD